jgi:hypothetical protein
MAQMTPIQAKSRYALFRRLRVLVLVLWALAGCGGFVLLFVMNATKLVGVSFGVLFLLSGYVIEYPLTLIRKSIRVFCIHCDKYIEWTADWVCGTCNHTETENIFFMRCSSCRESPRALVCPHCDELLYLDSSRSGKHPIQLAGHVKTHWASTGGSASEREMKELEDKKKLVMLRAELATAEAALAERLTARQTPTPKTLRQDIEERFVDFRDRNLCVRETADKALREAEEKYGKNSEMYARHRDMIQAWLEENLM